MNPICTASPKVNTTTDRNEAACVRVQALMGSAPGYFSLEIGPRLRENRMCSPGC